MDLMKTNLNKKNKHKWTGLNSPVVMFFFIQLYSDDLAFTNFSVLNVL